MAPNSLESLLNAWHQHTQKGGLEDFERQQQMRSLLKDLAPEPTYAIVAPVSGGSAPPKGATWLSHEILVLGDDSLYRFAGMEGVPDGHDEQAFSAAVTRVPFELLQRVQVTDIRLPEREGTKCRRRWDFFGESGSPDLSILVEYWAENGWSGPEPEFVHQLAKKLGWPVNDSLTS